MLYNPCRATVVPNYHRSSRVLIPRRSKNRAPPSDNCAPFFLEGASLPSRCSTDCVRWESAAPGRTRWPALLSTLDAAPWSSCCSWCSKALCDPRSVPRPVAGGRAHDWMHVLKTYFAPSCSSYRSRRCSCFPSSSHWRPHSCIRRRYHCCTQSLVSRVHLSHQWETPRTSDGLVLRR